MQQCLLVKETAQEFKEYLVEAQEKASNDDSEVLSKGVSQLSLAPADEGVDVKEEEVERGEDDDFDEEEEEENKEYSRRELVVVQSCVSLMDCSLDAIKHVLQVITTVADTLQLPVDNSNSSSEASVTAGSTVFKMSDATLQAVTSSSVINTNISSDVNYCEQWVAQLAYLTQSLNKDVLNLGAELYPPFEEEVAETVLPLYGTLKDHVASYLQLVSAPRLIHYWDATTMQKQEFLLAQLKSCNFI